MSSQTEDRKAGKTMTAVVVLASAMLLVPVYQEASRASVERCAATENELPRPSCYKDLARPIGLAPTSSATQGPGKWLVQTAENPLDDSTTVTMRLFADSGRSRMGDIITLVLRCQSNRTVAYIDWSDYLGSDVSVTWRIGQAEAQSGLWNISTDSQASFYPGGGSIGFIQDLMNVDRLVAQVTPYNESPVTAIFDLTGLSQAVTPLRETCNWTDEDLTAAAAARAAAEEEAAAAEEEAAAARAAAAAARAEAREEAERERAVGPQPAIDGEVVVLENSISWYDFKARYRWSVTCRNDSTQSLRITLNIHLVDRDGKTIHMDTVTDDFAPGQQKNLRGPVDGTLPDPRNADNVTAIVITKAWQPIR